MAAWHDTKSAAEYLRLAPDAIRDAVNAGHLRGKRVSGPTSPLRFREEWLDEYADDAWSDA